MSEDYELDQRARQAALVLRDGYGTGGGPERRFRVASSSKRGGVGAATVAGLGGWPARLPLPPRRAASSRAPSA